MTGADPDQPSDGRFVGGEHRLGVRVYHEDTDLTGAAYHASYIRWMERARSDMLRLAGIDQRAALDADTDAGSYAVASLAIRYRAPAHLGDALVVASRVAAVAAASITVHQRVSRGLVKLADAEVVAAWLGRSGRPRRQPAAWRARFTDLVQQGSDSLP